MIYNTLQKKTRSSLIRLTCLLIITWILYKTARTNYLWFEFISWSIESYEFAFLTVLEPKQLLKETAVHLCPHGSVYIGPSLRPEPDETSPDVLWQHMGNYCCLIIVTLKYLEIL